MILLADFFAFITIQLKYPLGHKVLMPKLYIILFCNVVKENAGKPDYYRFRPMDCE
jgi:hypothetical protein